jgi:hypothetical protein
MSGRDADNGTRGEIERRIANLERTIRVVVDPAARRAIADEIAELERLHGRIRNSVP